MTMRTNNKLRQAVSLALVIIALGAQSQASALGLGEIDVKSHLGEPLKAKIKIYGADDLTTGDASNNACFKLASDANNAGQINNARFSLGNIVNGESTLTVTTPDVISEPITNLAVIAECGGNFHREYVLLIDPAVGYETSTQTDDAPAPVIEAPAKPTKKSTKKHQNIANTQLTNVAVSTTDKKPKTHKKINKNNSLENPNIVLHVPGGNEQIPTAATPAPANDTTSKPHLSISGGTSQITAASNGLRMDKQLLTTPDENAPAIVNDPEMQDDLTAMNNRLSHLTAEVAKLQSRNIALETDNKVKAEQLEQNKSFKNQLAWLVYGLGGAFLYASGSAAFNWWRRRQRKQAEASWLALNIKTEQSEKAVLQSNNEQLFAGKPRQNANVADEKLAGDASNFEPTEADGNIVIHEEEHQDLSVLDHADVFLSHGRTSLAIQLLQNHLLDYPKQSVTVWLFLLDLMAKENMQAAYEQTALECKELFNIKISEFAQGDIEANQTLESFPRLAKGLQDVWGTPAALTFLDDLIYNNRLEPRVGFEKSVIDELLLLKTMAVNELNSAEIIQLDEKKLAIKERKDEQLEARRAEKLKQLAAEQMVKEEAEIAAVAKLTKEKTETTFDFKLTEF